MPSNKVVLKLDLHDDRDRKKAMKAVYKIPLLESIAMDMEGKKLTVIGFDLDPAVVVKKIKKYWSTEILSAGPVKEPEKENKKKDDKKKDKKDDDQKDESQNNSNNKQKKVDSKKGGTNNDKKQDSDYQIPYYAYDPRQDARHGMPYYDPQGSYPQPQYQTYYPQQQYPTYDPSMNPPYYPHHEVNPNDQCVIC